MFVTYKFTDIYVATSVAIVASLAQVGYLKLAGKKVEPMMWIALGLIVVFGGLTIILKNEMFVKWKPTILFATMAAAIAMAQFIFKKNPISMMFNNQIKAPDAVWRKLSIAWILFLLLVAVLNLVFVYYTSTDTWMLFKTFGDMGMFLVFIVAQVFWLMPYLEEDKPAEAAATSETAPNSSKDAAFHEGKV